MECAIKIERVALWCRDLIGQRDFCRETFDATAGPIYLTATKGFRSCCLRLEDGARLELMSSERLVESGSSRHPTPGYAHIAVTTGSTASVDCLAAAGHSITDRPRWTGDGCCESTVPDPEGNLLEIDV